MKKRTPGVKKKKKKKKRDRLFLSCEGGLGACFDGSTYLWSPIQSEGEDEDAFWDFDMVFLMLKPRDLKSENRASIPQRIP
jgi:hypothetical protein